MNLVTPATRAHISAIVSLLEEMDRFYGATEFPPLEERVKQVKEELFANDLPAGQVLLAWSGAELAGLASYSFLWPAVGVTRSLYLKELYVRQAHRRKGVGHALMREIAAIAISRRCTRLEWTTDVDNGGALAFYDQLRAPRNSDKIVYRFDAEDLRRLAAL